MYLYLFVYITNKYNIIRYNKMTIGYLENLENSRILHVTNKIKSYIVF